MAKWTEANATLKVELDGSLAPSPNEEYLLYQTLAAAWPLEPLLADWRSGAVVVPRLTARLGFPALGKLWKDTTIDLPAGCWRDAFFEHGLETNDSARAAEVLADFPVACLVCV